MSVLSAVSNPYCLGYFLYACNKIIVLADCFFSFLILQNRGKDFQRKDAFPLRVTTRAPGLVPAVFDAGTSGSAVGFCGLLPFLGYASLVV